MLIYSQTTGKLTNQDGTPFAGWTGAGYSGLGAGKNNPLAQGEAGVGPIPRGMWHIGAPYNSARTGPFTLPLIRLDGTPDDRDDATGRSAFRIHGDSVKAPGTASHGCIILPRIIREAIHNSRNELLQVIQ